MKSVDVRDIKTLQGKRLEMGDTFRFKCHDRLDCFNLCCRNLNLYLYPYDVLRLKNNLKISSDAFLDQYVDIVMKPSSFFPEVLLKMQENDEKTCPFLSEKGCSVYPDRPDTCRTFPVEHGLLFGDSGEKPEIVHFFRPPVFCKGRHETDEMTVASWAEDQNALIYNDMTARWAAVKALFHQDPWGPEGFQGPKGKMTFMAAYNIDAFQEFVFKSSFLKRYNVKPALQKKIKKNQADLLKFAFSWIKLVVWGIKTG
ncbi:MAG: YkgJ family cysteine cluster protein [Proteobacteria bacterium]|nr:YkgJ family cysteine cluster protein [Pseudomonadota bacterium]